MAQERYTEVDDALLTEMYINCVRWAIPQNRPVRFRGAR